ncbi:MerR family transcriptional regulator [Nocardiopsis sp. RSe5-2]|uniref:MerR family transcriptional regulator n=1 Tax=Nocardiopsis endophytica TaxID=3018445 RepID=A0ABT4U6F6_9ACTN|nr:MerR family transcriptional regulator [Nocardiopsis endophytica]MDA2812529.1 MerR family transcriptional regulator [Nocardiopsis endophytica]
MLISELAARTGVSARALRHYEERGVLVPGRDPNGYRVYAESDVVRVLQIKTMIDAGLPTSTVRRYIDCARSGDHGVTLEMCPALRAEVDGIAARLDEQRAALEDKRDRLGALAAGG